MWKKGRNFILWLMLLSQIKSLTSVESTTGDDGNIDHIEVKDFEGEYLGVTNQSSNSNIEVVYKAPKHLDLDDAEQSKPPCHLAEGDEPCVIAHARIDANSDTVHEEAYLSEEVMIEDESLSNNDAGGTEQFIYPGDSDGPDEEEPVVDEDPPALILDPEETDLIPMAEDAAEILSNEEDFRSPIPKDEDEFQELGNGSSIIGADIASTEEIGGRMQGRTMNIEPEGEKEPETAFIYGDEEGTMEGTSGRVEDEFYPAQIFDTDSTEIEEKISAAEAAFGDDEVGTRALKGSMINMVEDAFSQHHRKPMLRSAMASRVNVKRSSRGVEIRDVPVEKPATRPTTNYDSHENKRELFQMTQTCRNKVENDGWVGDGWCDKNGGYNTAACGWDGGDCCKHTCVSLGVEGYDCSSDFDCKDPTPAADAPFDYTACYQEVQTDAWVGDGYCDRTGGYNTAQCNYDGGDCCKSTCKHGSGGKCDAQFYCEDPKAQGGLPPPPTKSPTKAPTKSPTKAPVPAPVARPTRNGQPDYNVVSQACKNKVKNWQWVGDGWCDPDSQYNSPECAYDGGDCCKQTCKNGAYTCGSATGIGFSRCTDPWVLGAPPTPAVSPTTSTANNNSGSNNNSNNNNNSGFNQNLSGEPKMWLDYHNERRKRYQEQYGYSYVPLMWSNTIAQSAKSYANKLAAGRCEDYDHDPNNPWGENLAVIWGGHNIERVMKAWVENEELAPNAPYRSGNGHMTQALWRATKYLGCAWSENSQCKLYVCRYIKPGNCNRGVNTWLKDTMADNSPCGPNCPPNEGCFHPHDS